MPVPETLKCVAFKIPANRLFALLMTIVCLLTTMSCLVFLVSQVSPKNFWMVEIIQSLNRLFNLDGEANIPSWYSSSTLLIASALLATVALFKARYKAPYHRHWKFLAVIFLYISMDEAAVIHEMLNKPLRLIFNTEGHVDSPWVVIAGLCLIFLAFTYARFLLHLPSKIRYLFVISGVVFLTGAIGAEFVSFHGQPQPATNTLSYQIPMTVEEFLEMAGVAIFIYAILLYLNEHIFVHLCSEATRSTTTADDL